MSDAELERALVEVGRHLEYPEIEVAAAVGARLRREAPAHAPGPRPRRTILIATAALVVLLAGAAVAASLGVPGIGVRLGATDAPTGPPLALDTGFLGRRTSLEEARAAVDFPVTTVPGRPAPDVYVAGRRVSLVYPDLLITWFRADEHDDEVIRKLAISADPVPGGFWLPGPHDARFGDLPHTSGNTLILHRDGVTLRVETTLDREAALQVAQSL